MVRSVFAWRRCRRAVLRCFAQRLDPGPPAGPSASRSKRRATVCSRDSHARNLFRRARSGSASCAVTALDQVVDVAARPDRADAGHARPGHPGVARRVRAKLVAVGGQRRRASCDARRSWTPPRSTASVCSAAASSSAQSDSVSSAAADTTNTTAIGSLAGAQVRRLDELVLRQPLTQSGGTPR